MSLWNENCLALKVFTAFQVSRAMESSRLLNNFLSDEHSLDGNISQTLHISRAMESPSDKYFIEL